MRTAPSFSSSRTPNRGGSGLALAGCGNAKTASARPGRSSLQSKSKGTGSRVPTFFTPRSRNWCGTPWPKRMWPLPMMPTDQRPSRPPIPESRGAPGPPPSPGPTRSAIRRSGRRRCRSSAPSRRPCHGGGRVLAIDLEQEIAVRVRRRRRPADAFALRCRHRVPAFLRDGPGELLVDVERHHRDAVDARELEQRQIELGRQFPDRVPLRLLEQLPDGEIAGDPAIEHRLRAAREHLEADDHVRPLRVQRRQHLQLPAVIVVLVVLLAEQHDILFRHLRQHGGDAGAPGLPGIQHRPGGGIETGLGAGGRSRGAGSASGKGSDADRADSDGGSDIRSRFGFMTLMVRTMPARPELRQSIRSAGSRFEPWSEHQYPCGGEPMRKPATSTESASRGRRAPRLRCSAGNLRSRGRSR